MIAIRDLAGARDRFGFYGETVPMTLDQVTYEKHVGLGDNDEQISEITIKMRNWTSVQKGGYDSEPLTIVMKPDSDTEGKWRMFERVNRASSSGVIVVDMLLDGDHRGDVLTSAGGYGRLEILVVDTSFSNKNDKMLMIGMKEHPTNEFAVNFALQSDLSAPDVVEKVLGYMQVIDLTSNVD